MTVADGPERLQTSGRPTVLSSKSIPDSFPGRLLAADASLIQEFFIAKGR
jgi:hypothetical protein